MAARHRRHTRTFKVKAVSLAVASCFSVAVDDLLANPTDPTVVSGSANFNRQGNVLSVTNSPGAIINWRAFSIGSNEVTRFLQQSAASSVLNRVTGVDPSVILGALQSNGRVFLINPNGILFGAGAQIDVGGLVASTLNISNADFAAGRLRFTDTPGAGSVVNQGSISTPNGGQIYLIAPNVQNSGIINSPQGEVILAAGRSVEIVDAGTPNLRIEITAPDTQAVNLGQILASSGKIGIYAALIKNSGIVRADGVVIGQNGEILLRATKTVTLDKGSVISASGPTAGKVTIQADNGNVSVAGTVAANATQGTGGTVTIAGSQGVSIETTGKVSADGVQGGSVAVTSSAGSVAVAGTINANATAGRAGQIALSAATNAAVTAGAQLIANGVQGGSVSIAANSGVTLERGSLVQASGIAGGAVSVQAGAGSLLAQGTIDVTGTDANGGTIGISADSDITLDVTGKLLARGRAGGQVKVEASSGTLLASGLIDGRGTGGPGGLVWLLAPRVALIQRAVIDASGDTAGGEVLIGGDYQGKNLLIQNASRTYFGPDAVIRADAITAGDGGKVILWSNDGTQAYGTISARGGAASGSGGFIETSGKSFLDVNGLRVDASAAYGRAGMWLLDPSDITVVSGSAGALVGGVFDPAGPNSIGDSQINTALDGGTSVTLQTSGGSGGFGDITLNSGVAILNSTGGARTLTLKADRNIIVNSGASISGSAGNALGVTFNADADADGVGNVQMFSGSSITTFGGNIVMGGGSNPSTFAAFGSGSGPSPGVNGIHLDGATLNSGAGNISLIGTGAAGTVLGVGVAVIGGTTINANGGTITIYGTAGAGPVDNRGVYIANSGTLIQSTNGDITVTGIGAVTGSTSVGLMLDVGTSIVSTGTAKINLIGTSVGGGSGDNPGVYLAGGLVQGTNGDITVTGTGSGPHNAFGVWIIPGSGVISNGAAGITINGTGASGYAGILVDGGAGVNIIGGPSATGAIHLNAGTGDIFMSGVNVQTTGLATVDGANFQLGKSNASTSSVMNIGGDLTVNLTGSMVIQGGDTTLAGGSIRDASAKVNVGGNVIVNAGALTVAGGNAVASGASVAKADAELTAGGNMTLTIGAGGATIAAGGATVQAEFGESFTATAHAKVTAGNALTITVAPGGDLNILGGAAHATARSGSAAVAVAGADTVVSAGGDLNVTLNGGNLIVRGGVATAYAYHSGSEGSLQIGNNTATANANVALVGGNHATITVTGGSLQIYGGAATANAYKYGNSSGSSLSGTNNATANAGVTLAATAGNLTINTNAGGVQISAGSAIASASHVTNNRFNALMGDNTGNAHADVSVTAGGNLSITASGLSINSYNSASARALALKSVYSAGNSNSFDGINTAVATANTNLAAGGNLSIDLGVGGGSLYVRGARAYANASHVVNYGNSNFVVGDNLATATANTIFAAGGAGTLTINAGNVSLNSRGASANARHYIFGSSAAVATGNTLTGNNTANASADISATGHTVLFDLGNGTLSVSGNSVSARGGHDGGAYLSSNNLNGNQIATASGNITVSATGGSLTVNATGGITVYGGSASAEAYKTIRGSGQTVSGNNAATANANIDINGQGVALNLGSGNLSVHGAVATADAYQSALGSSHTLSGNHTTTANANVTIAANTGTLAVHAGNLYVSGDGGEGSGRAYARAYLQASGSNNIVSPATNTATAARNITLSGNSVALTLGSSGGAGQLGISAGRAVANAFHSAAGVANSLSGSQSATADDNISINATGGTLTVTARGRVSILGNSASANAYKITTGSSHTLAGSNSAVANNNILIGATTGLTINAAGLAVNSSGARNGVNVNAYQKASNGAFNAISGVETATGGADIKITSGGNQSLTLAGDLVVNTSSARHFTSVYAYQKLSNASHTSLTGTRTASGHADILFDAGGTLDVTVTAGDMKVNDGLYNWATAYAYRRIQGAFSNGSNTLTGNNQSTAHTSIGFTSTGSLGISVTGGSLNVNTRAGFPRAYNYTSAYAYNEIGTDQNQATGNNVSQGDALISFQSRGGGLTVTAATGMAVNGNSNNYTSVYAYNQIGGNNNTALNNLHNTATGNAKVTFDAGTNLSIDVTAGGLTAKTSYAAAYASNDVSGNGNVMTGAVNSATATALAGFTAGGNINIHVRSGDMTLDKLYASVYAYNRLNGGGNNLTATNTATGNSNIVVSAGGGLTVAVDAGALNIRNSYASVYAQNRVNSSANTLAGTNVATGNANIQFNALGTMAINTATGVTVNGSYASVYAYNQVNGAGNTVGGTNNSTGNANITFTANTLNVDVAGGNFAINAPYASAVAYSIASGSAHAITGANTATANANVSLIAGSSQTINVNAGGFNIYQPYSTWAEAYHSVSGVTNTVSGAQSATANNSINIAASGALAVNALGGISIQGNSAEARAYKSVSGSGHAVSGNNTASATNTISVSAGSVALSTLATASSGASFYVRAGGAFADAYHNVSGTNSQLSGAHSATATGGVVIAATGALTVNAGRATLDGAEGANATAYMRAFNSNNTIGIASAASNSATAGTSVTLTAGSVQVSLVGSGAGTMHAAGNFSIRGGSSAADAQAYHSGNGNFNQLTGNNIATTNRNIGLLATSGPLSITADGGMSVSGAYAQANASQNMNFTGNVTVTGNDTATVSSSIKLSGGSVTIGLGTGVSISGSSARARASHNVFNGSANAATGNLAATAFSDISLNATAGVLSITAPGGISITADGARANTLNNVVGPGNTTTGSNTALAQSNILLSSATGDLTLNAGGAGILIAAGNALASASNFGAPSGVNTTTAHSNVLAAAAGNMTISAGSLTVQGGSVNASASGSGANAVMANANAGIIGLSTTSITAANAVNVNGGSTVSTFGTGAAASAFAMIDPASLGITADTVNLNTNAGGVILSAFGAPINVVTTSGFFVNSVLVPGGFASLGTTPGINFGQALPMSSSLTTADPLVIVFGSSSQNLTTLFGLPAGFLSLAAPPTIFWDGGGGDSLWFDPLNWSTNVLPVASQDVIIGSFSPITLAGGFSNIKSLNSQTNLIVNAGAGLNITNASTISNTLTMSGGTVTANAGMTVDSLSMTAGTLNGLGTLKINNSFAQTGGSIANTFGLIDITQAAGNLVIGNPLTAGAINLTATAGNINVLDTTITAAGAMNVTASGNLNVTASTAPTVMQAGGLQTISANGIYVQGASSGSNLFATIHSAGGQNITAGAGGITLTGGAGTGSFNSATIYQTSVTNPQTITINGGGAININGGTGSGGNNFAYIWNQSTGAPQTINFAAGGSLALMGGTGAGNNNALLENDAGIQSITGNPALTLAGGASGFNNFAWLLGNAGQNITASSIIMSGGAGGTQNYAEILQQGATSNQTVTVNGAGTVTLSGGGGAQNRADITNMGRAQTLAFTGAGTLNATGGSAAGGFAEAQVANQGPGATVQTISFTGGGAINLTGGTVGIDNTAEIHAFTGNQTITGNPDIALTGGASGGAANNSNDANISLKFGTGTQTINAGTLSLTGGAGGVENVATISANTSGQNQFINTTGSVTITGGAGTDAVAAIASDQSNVNITLNAGGPVTLTGGTGGFSTFGALAAIGAVNGFNANVVVNGQAGISLTKGAGLNANAFIGTDTGAPAITLVAGLGGAGNLALNDGLIGNLSGVFGNVVMQAPNGVISQTTGGIRANNLFLSASGNITLPGTNNLNTVAIGSGSNVTINEANSIGINATNITGALAVTAPGNVSLNGAVTAASVNLTSTTGFIDDPSGALITAPSITLTAATGVSMNVNNPGAGLNVTNTGATGNVSLTSYAPLFTVGGGGANFSNAAPGGGYYITAAGDMVVNNNANNRFAYFGAANQLTVNGYTNASGAGTLMAGTNVAFSGAATSVTGPMSVIAGGGINVTTTVQADSVNVIANDLIVDAGSFSSLNANFVGTLFNSVAVKNGGVIFGNPDVKLQVGQLTTPGLGISIDDPGSKIEAYSPNSIHISFPGLSSGGFSVNGNPGQVWDPATLTGFHIGQTNAAAVLGQNLLIDYGIVGLPQDVIQAINTSIASVNQSVPSTDDDNKNKIKVEKKDDPKDKTLSNNLKLMCN